MIEIRGGITFIVDDKTLMQSNLYMHSKPALNTTLSFSLISGITASMSCPQRQTARKTHYWQQTAKARMIPTEVKAIFTANNLLSWRQKNKQKNIKTEVTWSKEPTKK